MNTARKNINFMNTACFRVCIIQVIDPITLHTFLADESQLKFMQTQILDREFTRGAKVCYNDGEGWIEGVVEDTDAVGAAFVL